MAITVSVIIPAKSAENGGCIEWTGFKSRDGYGIANRGGKLIKRHRLAYCEAHGFTLSQIQGSVVRHKCDNRACINPEHLELGTSQDNTNDRHQRGRDARGSSNGNSKLTEAEVSEIRKRYQPHSRARGARALGKEFGVSASLIGQIISGAIWRHVTE